MVANTSSMVMAGFAVSPAGAAADVSAVAAAAEASAGAEVLSAAEASLPCVLAVSAGFADAFAGTAVSPSLPVSTVIVVLSNGLPSTVMAIAPSASEVSAGLFAGASAFAVLSVGFRVPQLSLSEPSVAPSEFTAYNSLICSASAFSQKSSKTT